MFKQRNLMEYILRNKENINKYCIEITQNFD